MTKGDGQVSDSDGNGHRAGRLISLREAARVLGVHHSTLSRAARRGQLKPAGATPGGWVRYRLQDIERLQAAGITGSASPQTGGPVMGGPAPGGQHEEALAALPDLARRLVGADYAAVTVLDGSGRVQRMYHAGLSREQTENIGPPPTGRGVLGALGPQDAPLRLDNISGHPRSVGFPSHHPPMEALLGVKVGGGGLKANLYVANAPGRSSFTLRDEELVKALAGYARLAIANEELLGRESALREQTEQAIRQLEAVIHASPAAVIVFDASTHRVLTANATARSLTDIPLAPGSPGGPEEAPLRFLHADGSALKPEETPSVRAAAVGKPVGPVEILFAWPDGTRKPMLCSAAPVFAPGGGVTSVVVVFQDLSHAKELDQVKQDFFSMVTHDLRSPTATIKGITRSALAEVESGSSTARYLDEIDEEADFLTDLVSNLLDMSRIEAGVNLFEPESCHMADIVDDAIRRARRSRLAAGREITADVPADLPPLFADPQQAGRVLDNLLSNALKYSAGPVFVRSFVDRGSRIVTEVTDKGEGVPASHIDGIFSKFFRVRQGMRRGREGAGLGLAICKAIIEAHNGEIGVRSKEREGSTFWFALPAEVRGAGT